MHSRRWRIGGLVAGMLPVLTILLGCSLNPVPPEEAVLAGTWRLLHDGSDELQVFYEFDELGRLREVRYELGEFTIRINSFSLSRVDVDGSAVSIRFRAILASSEFEGTLNASNDRMEGQVTTQVTILPGLAELDIDNGPAVLVKQ
jgi:hypothetical protein